MKTPLVSICVPTYKQVDFLRKNLESIRDQSFQDFEVIISDDTPDSSVYDLAKTFISDPRFQYFHNQPGLGSPRNWNESIRKASGKYIKILHHDDSFSMENSLELFVQLLESKPDAHFAFSACNRLDKNNNRIGVHSVSADYISELEVTPDTLLLANLIGPPSVILFRSIHGRFFDERLKWLVDTDFYVSFIKDFPKVAYSSEPLIDVCTEGKHQVTHECAGNIEVEIPELLILYEKNEEKLHSPKKHLAHIKQIFSKFGIGDIESLTSVAKGLVIPDICIAAVKKKGVFTKAAGKIRNFLR